MTQLQQQAANNPNLTFWDLITGDAAGTITVVLLLVAYVLYALAIIVFCFFYTLFGSVLYVLGPLVLALIPDLRRRATGEDLCHQRDDLECLGHSLCRLWRADYRDPVQPSQRCSGNGFLGFLHGAPDSVNARLGQHLLRAVAIALIPFIAKRIISGDVGSTAFALVRAGALPPARLWLESADLPPERVRRIRCWQLRGGRRCRPASSRLASGVFHAAPDAGTFHGGVSALGNRQRDEQQHKPGCPCP